MWTSTRWTRLLGVRLPIVQGPLGGGHSTPALAAAVSDAGGLGSLGVYHLAPAEIRAAVAETRRRTAAPFGVNLWVPVAADPGGAPDAEAVRAARALLRPFEVELGLGPDDAPVTPRPQPFDAQVEAVLDERPAVLSFTFGVPPAGVVVEARRRGIITVATATTVDEAEAVEAAGVDAVCASGFEAGGHRAAFLRPAEESLVGTMALVPQVVDAVRVPVIAAGGIADGRGVVAALALGAAAAQIGTAFLACDESGAHPLHRAARRDARRARQTVLTRAFSGRLARAVRNRFADVFAPHASALLPWPAQGAVAGPLRQAAAAAGRDDVLALWSGQAAPLATRRRAADLVRGLEAEAAAVLAGWSAGPASG